MQLQYGTTTIEYELSYSERTTLAISVHPDLQVTVEAPDTANLSQIEAKIRKRANWILKQQRDFEKYLPGLPPRQYVSGETHWYLGKQYRLKVVPNNVDVVKLARGYLFVNLIDQSNPMQVKALLEHWYRKQAGRIFKQRLDACYAKIEPLGIPYPEFQIRVMESRWGSCTPSGRILLNLKLIQVPKLYIDYVIFHELCHLKEPNHSKQFYALLERVLPDWETRKQQLNEFFFA